MPPKFGQRPSCGAGMPPWHLVEADGPRRGPGKKMFEQGQVGGSRSRRRYRATKAGGVIVATALSLAFVAPPSATATPSTKYYTVSAVVLAPPLPVTVDVATTVHVTLQNSTTSSQSFGSAELTVENVPAADVAVNTPAPLSG